MITLIERPNMKFEQHIVLTLDEVKNDLINWSADTIINDRANIIDQMKHGLPLHVPFHTMSPTEITNMYGDLNLAEKYVTQQIDKVFVEIAPEKYELVWDKENIEPERLKTLFTPISNITKAFARQQLQICVDNLIDDPKGVVANDEVEQYYVHLGEVAKELGTTMKELVGASYHPQYKKDKLMEIISPYSTL